MLLEGLRFVLLKLQDGRRLKGQHHRLNLRRRLRGSLLLLGGLPLLPRPKPDGPRLKLRGRAGCNCGEVKLIEHSGLLTWNGSLLTLVFGWQWSLCSLRWVSRLS